MFDGFCSLSLKVSGLSHSLVKCDVWEEESGSSISLVLELVLELIRLFSELNVSGMPDRSEAANGQNTDFY